MFLVRREATCVKGRYAKAREQENGEEVKRWRWRLGGGRVACGGKKTDGAC